MENIEKRISEVLLGMLKMIMVIAMISLVAYPLTFIYSFVLSLMAVFVSFPFSVIMEKDVAAGIVNVILSESGFKIAYLCTFGLMTVRFMTIFFKKKWREIHTQKQVSS